MIKISPRSAKISPEPRSRVRTFSAPLLTLKFGLVLSAFNSMDAFSHDVTDDILPIRLILFLISLL